MSQNAFEPISNPFEANNSSPSGSGQTADEWEQYETVNDPRSGKNLPLEGHATDPEEDEWESCEVVNDPRSGKPVPNEGHSVGVRL